MRDAGYRTTDEVESWKGRDPLAALRAEVVAAAAAEAEEFDQIDAEVQREAEEAIAFAKASAFPDASTAALFVYSEA